MPGGLNAGSDARAKNRNAGHDISCLANVNTNQYLDKNLLDNLPILLLICSWSCCSMLTVSIGRV